MVEVMLGIFETLYFYFLKIPMLVCLFVCLSYGVLYFMNRERDIREYFVMSDFLVAFLTLPFWGVCTALPCTSMKSMANLQEPMILGLIWSGMLAARFILVMRRMPMYNRLAMCGNVSIFIMCVLFCLLLSRPTGMMVILWNG